MEKTMEERRNLNELFKKSAREKAILRKKGEKFTLYDLFGINSGESFTKFGLSMVDVGSWTRTFEKDNADIVEKIGKERVGSNYAAVYRRI